MRDRDPDGTGPPPDAVLPTPDRQVVRAEKVLRLDLPPDSAFIVSRDGSRAAVVDRDLADILDACSRYARVDAHAARIAAAVADTYSQQQILAALVRLGEAGWLRPPAEPDAGAGPDAAAPALTLDAIGWITADRPQVLAEGLDGFAAHLQRHGRRAHLIVADDSRVPRHAGDHRRLLADAGARHGLGARYLGPVEKESYASHLAAAADIDPALAAFALGIDTCVEPTIGGNRNVLLLDQVGHPFLGVDDDVRCRWAVHPETAAGVRLKDGGDPADCWSLVDRDEALALAPPPALDLLAQHERLLGRPLAGLIGEAGADAVTGLSGGLPAMAVNGAHVRVTVSGTVGDSGMPTHGGFLWDARPAARARLLASEASYERFVTSREVLRVAPQFTVLAHTPCMGACWGLDARAVLPPCVPRGRAEDCVFGAVLARVDGTAVFGHLPLAMLHDAARGRELGRPASPFSTRSLGDLLLTLVSNWPGVAGAATPEHRLRRLGQYLQDAAAQSSGTFAALLLEQAFAQARELMRLLDGLVVPAGPVGDRLRADARQCRADTVEALRSGAATAANDYVRAGLSPDDARERTRHIVGRYGALLERWPEVWQAATVLRARGVRPSVPV